MINALTIDIEEWFQVTSFDSVVKIDEWDNYESRVVDETLKLLCILQQYEIKATFFVLGYVAEKHPEIIRRMADYGHEVAIHGYSHRLVSNLSPKEFATELLTSKEIVEQITGQEVIGYRAPSYSITDSTRWVFDILEENGIKYDSSILPGGLRFGISDEGRFPYNISKKGNLIEFPVSTIRFLGKLVPFSGGLFLRIFPYFFIKSSIKKINSRGNPVMIYIHPWELDVNHPKVDISFEKKFIHYFNLKSTEKKLKSLLSDFKFGTVKEVLFLNKL
jgi:polysaccharide deacetylase family protein (PEP-CTERM system associated)